MGKKILLPCFNVIMIAFFPRKIQWKSTFLILNQLLGGGGGDSGFQVTGRIKWGKNQNPEKYLDQKLTAKKSNAQFPSLKNFQKALNDNYNAKKYNHSEINWIVLTFFLHQTIWSYHTLALPRIFRLFWIPQKSPLKSIHEKKYLPNYPSQKKIPQSKISNSNKSFDHPHHLKFRVPPGGPSHLTYSENPSGFHRYRAWGSPNVFLEHSLGMAASAFLW